MAWLNLGLPILGFWVLPTHRYWTCPVLQSLRDKHCPAWLLDLIKSEMVGTNELPCHKLLLYTRALHKSVEPCLACKPARGTFDWIVEPVTLDAIPYGRVYADGSRLYSEQRYCNLLARHGWAFVVVDQDGKVVAGASGTVPWWINGIYGAELWALLQAASFASLGSPLHVDCNAVRMGVHNGLSWARSPSRKLARAWIPLANILEGGTDSVAWLPAHCDKSAVGVRELSNGRKLDGVDLSSNALVDTWAKREAKSSAPNRSEFKIVEDATKLVDCIARWIGICTREANHFPAPEHQGRAKYIRDTTARSDSTARAKRDLVKNGVTTSKRKTPSAVGTACVATFSSSCGQTPAEFSLICDKFSRAKRHKLSHKQVEEKADFVFMEHWLAQRESLPQLTPPPVSAVDRLAALRARVTARGSSV